MTQDEYKLYTGQEAPAVVQSDWETLLGVAEMRLASFLCLETLPDPLPDDLKDLLANFMSGVFETRGKGEERVSSKSVRNFTISFQSGTAATAFEQIAYKYGDIIAKYSQCGVSLSVERDWKPCDDRF